MALFGKSKKSGDGGKAADTGFKRNPKKGRRFFEHAETVADSKQYDYAIDLYIDGLRHSPDAMDKHEELLEVAKRRKVSGGKPGRAKKFGSEAIDVMLHAEKVWAMDFTNPKLAYEVMKQAVTADQDEANAERHLGEVAFWIGEMAADFNAASKKPSKILYLNIRDRFSDIGRFDKAVDCHRRAISLTPDDANLIAELKDLEAQKYTMARKEAGTAMSNVKDAEQQEMIQRELSGHGGGDANQQLIAARRTEYEEDPEDIDKLSKLADALLRTGEDTDENEAIELLHAAHQSTTQYRFKTRAGDIKMKQLVRAVRNYKQFVDAVPDSEEYQEKYKAAVKERLDFELTEYQGRVKNYPTDLRLKYEFGRRLFQAELYDEAIGMLQQASAEPKSRSSAHLLLGRSFMAKEWIDEAVSTLQSGFDQHEVKDDKVGKELRYDLMLAHKQIGLNKKDDSQLETAQQHASALLQADINYKDIRTQIEDIRNARKSLEGDA